MSTLPDNIREQVMAQIITTMEQAIAAGRDPMEAAEAAYPGTPSEVLCRAEMEVEDRGTEAWWRNIEKSIDSAVIQAAIAGPTHQPVPAGSRDAHLDEAFEALTADDGGAA